MAADRISGMQFPLGSDVPMNQRGPCWEARPAMKTTVHLHRPPPPRRAGPPCAGVRSSTLRLGLVVSLVAAVVAIVARGRRRTCRSVLILIPVVDRRLRPVVDGRAAPSDGGRAALTSCHSARARRVIVGRWSHEGAHRRRPRGADEAPRARVRGRSSTPSSGCASTACGSRSASPARRPTRSSRCATRPGARRGSSSG